MKKMFLIVLTIGLAGVTSAQLTPVTYHDGGQQLDGLLARSGNSGQEGVLILPAWMGIDEESKIAAEELAKSGYIAFVADIYGTGKTPKSASEAGKIAGEFKQDYQLYQRRIRVALDQLVKQGANPQKIAVIGYCFGGTGALEAARGGLPIVGAVSIHGGLSKGVRPNGPIATKVLVLHGAADASVPPGDIEALHQELDESKVDWQMIYYADSKHTFTNPASKDYNEIAARRSWKHLLLFLREVLNGE